MELKINLGYDEVLALIKQLPSNQIAKLKSELNANASSAKNKSGLTPLQEILLQGPVMEDEQEETYKQIRKRFQKWRAK